MRKIFLTVLLVSVSVYAMAAPYAVTGLSVYNCGGIKLVWDAPSDTSTAVSYVVNRSVVSAGPYDLTATASANNYYDASADTTLAYYYTVKSVDFTGVTGAASAAKSTLPASPENLQAVPYNSKNMLLWQPSSDSAVEEYNIYRSTGFGFKLINTTGETQYTDENLANGTLYWYTAASVKNSAEGAFACSVSAKPFIPPFPVSGAGVSVSAGELNAEWTSSGLQGTYEIDSYKIFRSTSYGDESFSPASVTYTSYSETLPIAGQLYYYAIRTIDTQGNSSPAYWFSAYNPGLPSAPTGITVTTANAARINIVWQANPADENITAYQVIRDAAVIAVKATPTAASYEDMDVVLGNTYSYYIQAINSFGTGAGSSAVTLTVMPASPAGVTAMAGSLPGEVFLNWTDNNEEENIQAYNIYRATSADTFNYTSPYISTGTAGAIDAAAVTGTPYFYRVSALTQTAY